MKLTVLGSGSYQPELNRHSSSHLIQISEDNLVFDFGRGAPDQLMRIGINYYDINAIFISHFHPDHYNDLNAFLHIALAEPEKGKFRKKDMTVYLPAGGLTRYKSLLDAGDLAEFKPKYKVNVIELRAEESLITKNWTIIGYYAKHSANSPCYCYRLEAKDKIFAYSGDTEDCPGLRQAIKNANLALMEASHPAELKPIGHLTAEQAGLIAARENVKKLVLTHMSPYYLQNYDVKKLAQKYFPGPTILAKDLLEINI